MPSTLCAPHPDLISPPLSSALPSHQDVLIRPKRSTLKSRSQVSLERTIRMKHSGKELNCVPIIAAKSVQIRADRGERDEPIRCMLTHPTPPPPTCVASIFASSLLCSPFLSMDTVGTFEMAVALARSKILTAVHKHYTVEQWQEFIGANAAVLPYLAVSSGISEDDFKKLQTILALNTALETICLDVANGSDTATQAAKET